MDRVLQHITSHKLPTDANIDSSHFLYQNFYLTAIRNIVKKRVPWIENRHRLEDSIALESSWINWDKYKSDSEMINKLWNECDDSAGDLLNEILGYKPYELPPDLIVSKYDFINLLTIGLWFKYGYQGK